MCNTGTPLLKTNNSGRLFFGVIYGETVNHTASLTRHLSPYYHPCMCPLLVLSGPVVLQVLDLNSTHGLKSFFAFLFP